MHERTVEKTGWEVLKDAFGKKAKSEGGATAPTSPNEGPPVLEMINRAFEALKLPYNPLRLAPGDIVLLQTSLFEGTRFVVNKVAVMCRTIGSQRIYSTDYVLCDPTGEEQGPWVGIRALDEGDDKVSFLLLLPDGDNPYVEELEKMLLAMKPGDPTGFPRQEEAYTGLALTSYAPPEPTTIEVSEYTDDGKSTTSKVSWDFVRDVVVEGFSRYLIEMNTVDGYFYCYRVIPCNKNEIRCYRF